MDNGNPILGFAILGLVVVLYLLPALIAAARAKRNAASIFALNLLLGWSCLGWVLALIWALSYDAPDPQA